MRQRRHTEHLCDISHFRDQFFDKKRQFLDMLMRSVCTEFLGLSQTVCKKVIENISRSHLQF